MDVENISKPDQRSVTIASGQKLSTAINMIGYRGGLAFFPATMTGATLAVLVSSDGVNFVPLYDNAGNAQSITVEASSACEIPAGAFAAPWLQFQSASNEAAVRSVTLTLAS